MFSLHSHLENSSTVDIQKSFGMELQKGENNLYGLHRLQKT